MSYSTYQEVRLNAGLNALLTCLIPCGPMIPCSPWPIIQSHSQNALLFLQDRTHPRSAHLESVIQEKNRSEVSLDHSHLGLKWKEHGDA